MSKSAAQLLYGSVLVLLLCLLVFNNHKPMYQQALNNAGYNFNLEYKEKEEIAQNVGKNRRKRRRKRNTLFFNPPWSGTVETNVGRKFFQALDSSFPPDHVLHPILNRKVVRVSYSCTRNIARVISSHNAKVATSATVAERNPGKQCNCHKTKKGMPNTCPFGGKCLTDNVVYCATVTTSAPRPAPPPPAVTTAGRRGTGRGRDSAVPRDTAQGTSAQWANVGDRGDEKPDNVNRWTYTGLTSNTFKKRLYGHNWDFNHESCRTNTTLSGLIWSLKDDDIDYTISWSQQARAPTYSPSTRQCLLCCTEKLIITHKSDKASINKRNELYNHCRHMDSKLLTPHNSNNKKSRKEGLG